MLINWMSSSLQQSLMVAASMPGLVPPTPTTTTTAAGIVSDQDIIANQLILQFCTNLLVAGVIKQIPDKYAPIQETFRVSQQTFALMK